MKRDIIILHGWGLDGSRFAPLKKELEKHGVRVWAPDFPGFGTEKSPEIPFHLFEYVTFLHAFIKKHRIQSPGLIGHSFGGRVALKFDSLFPKSTSWIVLTGTPGYRSASSLKVFIAQSIAKVGKLLVSLPFVGNFKDSIAENYYSLIGAREYVRANGTMKETFKHVVAESFESYMKSLSVPCLLIWGDEDRMVPIRTAHKMLGTITGATLSIIKGYGHSVPYMNPVEFVKRMHVRHFI